jgi:hypothetical protein
LWFVRRIVHRTRDQNEAILSELRETINELDGYHGSYPRNDSACRSRFGTCVFLGVCAGVEQLDSEKFIRIGVEHQELANGDEYQFEDCPL